MGKHEYLIMAHSDWDLLSKLLKCIDDGRNTIFIHIDKKSKFESSMVYKTVNAKCTFIKRRKVAWGGLPNCC